MNNPAPALTMALRCVIASCIACSLLMLPSFASAQGELGTFDQGSGTKVEPLTEPATEKEPDEIVITPGAPAETPAVDGAALDQGANVDGESIDGESIDGGAVETGEVETGAVVETEADADAAAKLEERRAAWMAELQQLNFKQLVKRIRDDERKIDQLYINMPMSIPDQQLQYERYIRSLQAEVVVLHELLEPAAVEAFRSDPMESKAATEKVFEVLASKLAPRGRQSKYDPAGGLRLVNTILEIKGGNIGVEPGAMSTPEDKPFMEIIFQGYLASYGLQDFESANAFLTRIENLEIGLDPALRENFEATLAAWKSEESLRAAEARADNLPRVKLETTDGDVIIELFENEAPNTVANFIKLVKEEYYDGLEFFHVVPSNYARSGCKANDGTTNPGYRIRNEYDDARRHFAGTVVMQNDGENTAGSQYIILHRPDPNLVGKVVAFGRVIEGLEIVYGFKTVNRIRNPGGEATIVNKATVLRDRGHAYDPEIIEDAASLIRQQADEVMASGSPQGAPASGSSNREPAATNGSSTRGSSTNGSSTRGSSTSGSSNR